MKYKVASLELVLIGHATEDPEVLAKLINRVLPDSVKGRVRIERRVMKGYYGNQITMYTVKLSGDEASEALSYILSRMEDSSKKLLKATADLRIQKPSTIHLRLHKQFLTEDRFVLWDGDDVVKVKVRFKSSRELKKMLDEI